MKAPEMSPSSFLSARCFFSLPDLHPCHDPPFPLAPTAQDRAPGPPENPQGIISLLWCDPVLHLGAPLRGPQHLLLQGLLEMPGGEPPAGLPAQGGRKPANITFARIKGSKVGGGLPIGRGHNHKQRKMRTG